MLICENILTDFETYVIFIRSKLTVLDVV